MSDGVGLAAPPRHGLRDLSGWATQGAAILNYFSIFSIIRGRGTALRLPPGDRKGSPLSIEKIRG
jgi:hypothetical protein